VTRQIVRIEGRQLALMTHPCVLLPFPTRDEWTAETVAEAFAADLAAREQPVGIQGMAGEVRGVSSVFWSADESG
jgi:hypothetical protein